MSDINAVLWIDANNPPKKNGQYTVEFYFKNRPEYDCIEIATRGFYDGKWDHPYYDNKNDGSVLRRYDENSYQVR